MMEGFERISYENVFRGRRYDIDCAGGLQFRNVEVLDDPVMYGNTLQFHVTDGLFSQDISGPFTAYIKEVK